MYDENEEQRAAFTAGLRKIADTLDATPAMPLPYSGSESEVLVFTRDFVDLRTWHEILEPGAKITHAKDTNYPVQIHGQIAGVGVILFAQGDVIAQVTCPVEMPDLELLASVLA